MNGGSQRRFSDAENQRLHHHRKSIPVLPRDIKIRGSENTSGSSGKAEGKPTLGRSSGFRIILLTAPSRAAFSLHSGLGSVRSRLQRRDRNGVTPFSLFFESSTRGGDTQVRYYAIRNGSKIQTGNFSESNLPNRRELGIIMHRETGGEQDNTYS